jgi:hypothetical protein
MKFKYSTSIADSKSDLPVSAEIAKPIPNIDYRAKLVPPALCDILGQLGIKHSLYHATLIRQVYFWMNTSAGCFTKDGRKWIYNRAQDWVRQIPSYTEWKVRDVIRDIARLGIFIKDTYAGLKRSFVKRPLNFQEYNQTSFLTIDMDRLRSLAEQFGHTLEQCLECAPGASIAIATLEDSYSNNARLPQQQSTICTEISISNPDTHPNTQDKKTGKSTNKTQEVSQYKDDPWVDTPEQSSQPKTYQEVSSVVEQSPPEDTNAPEVREIRNRKLPEKTENAVRELYVWEVEVNKPIAQFLRWRANRHYKPQGKHFATGASKYAYSEFYNDVHATTYVLFPEFLAHGDTETQSVKQNQANGLVGYLSPDFIPDPEPTEENLQQLKQNYIEVIKDGARVLTENKGAPSSTQSITPAEAEAHSKLKPLPKLKEQLPPSQDSKPEVNEDDKLLNDFYRNQAKWKHMPSSRESVKQWAKNTPGVMVTEDGISLEPELERRLFKQPPS